MIRPLFVHDRAINVQEPFGRLRPLVAPGTQHRRFFNLQLYPLLSSLDRYSSIVMYPSSPLSRGKRSYMAQLGASPLKRLFASKIATDLGLLPDSLRKRTCTGGTNRKDCQEHRKLLTTPEELTLVAHIRCMAACSLPIGPGKNRELANEIRNTRLIAAGQTLADIIPVGRTWVNNFQDRYPMAHSAYSRSRKRARLNGCVTARCSLSTMR